MTWTGSGENIGARKDGRNWPALARFERSCAILLEGSERRKDICLTKVERRIEILVSLVGYREGIYTGVVCYPKYTKCGKSRAIWRDIVILLRQVKVWQVKYLFTIYLQIINFLQISFRFLLFCNAFFIYLNEEELFEKNFVIKDSWLIRCNNLVTLIDSI